MIMLYDIILIYSEYSITVLTNYKYGQIICHHPEGGLNINYSYCAHHMKGLGLAFEVPCMFGTWGCMFVACMLGPCRSDSNLI